MSTDVIPAGIVDDVLEALVARLRARDVEGTLALFAPDAALFGSEAGESAQGRDGLRAFLGSIFARPATYGWTWESPFVARHGDVLWFVASARAVLLGDDGNEQSLDYRLSGVLREHNPGEWLFELFNGSEPAQG